MVLAIGLLLCPVVVLSSWGAAVSKRPNIVVLLADDAGWGDYSHSGNKQVSTPNIDSIAEKGVSLDRFYVCPVCSPTRAEFLTGRYHLRCGVRGVSEGAERLNLDEKTVADAFKAAGYATGAFGKWHNGSQWPYHPMARGFDEYFGYTSGHWGEYFDAPLEEKGRMVKTKGYIVDVCTERTLEFIERNKARPFLCYVPFTTPHSPWAVPQKDWDRFKQKKIDQVATESEQESLDETRCALAMLENQDWNVGRILEKLREHHIEDNTVVIYFSDNGPNSHRWTGGMKGVKGKTDEAGVRSVCYMRWPGHLPEGRTIPQISGAIDLLPTLTSIAGIQRVGDKALDGRDLSPLLFNQSVAWPERMIFSFWAGNASVRTQTHRLDNKGQLFDMIHDPGQKVPRNVEEPELVGRLSEALKAWRSEMFGAPVNIETARKKGVDSRPIPVGYREFPRTILPARDGEPRGGVKRSAQAPNSSYFISWTSVEDSMVWRLGVHTRGRYSVSIDYTCPLEDVGSTIELAFKNARLKASVNAGWDPPVYANQDTLPRGHGESPMKEFHTLSLGEMDLEEGEDLLTLRALEIPRKSVMDVRRLTLTLIN
jgi:arylsulfatase A-like enzyme